MSDTEITKQLKESGKLQEIGEAPDDSCCGRECKICFEDRLEAWRQKAKELLEKKSISN